MAPCTPTLQKSEIYAEEQKESLTGKAGAPVFVRIAALECFAFCGLPRENNIVKSAREKVKSATSFWINLI